MVTVNTTKVLHTFFTVALSLLCLIAVLLFISNIFLTNSNQFSDQTKSFLKGHTDIPQNVDTVEYKGKYYWHIGPFPSVILLPAVFLFGDSIKEWHGHEVIIVVIAYLVYLLAKKYRLSNSDAAFITFAFLVSSILIRVVVMPISWHFAQLISVALLLGILLEMKTKYRLWLLGILLSAIVATRVTAAGIALIIAGKIITNSQATISKKIRQCATLAIPIVLTMVLLLWFNYIRFGQLFINAYELSHVEPALLPMRKQGLFSIKHVLPSLYFYFIAPFELVKNDKGQLAFPFITYNFFGMSMVLVAPFFLYSLRTFQKVYRFLLPYWVVIFATLSVLLCYFSRGGYMAYGPRYISDFLPLLLFLVLESQKRPLTNFQKILILLSGAFNLYMIASRIIMDPFYSL